jgi:tetratricopeptide (TPR) repeat protein
VISPFGLFATPLPSRAIRHPSDVRRESPSIPAWYRRDAVDCPDEGTLLSYAAGELDGVELDRVDEHVDVCRACAELVALAAREPVAGTRWSGETGTRCGAIATTGPDEVPYEIGRYIILGRLGQGGMGTVFAAYDPRLERHVAIKVLRRDRSIDARRLRMEARSLAALAHPNVVSVFEIGDAAGALYLVMELVDGVTLRLWCRDRKPVEILAAYVEAGRGLAAAHAAGLVHRDFKPDNVLVGRNGARRIVRVTDFGLARATESSIPSESGEGAWSSVVLAHAEHLTEAGAVTGTPAYMAPEQREGASVDARADQYAFCVSLWEALAGTRPHDCASSKVALHVDAHVRRALRRGLDADPSRRWPDMNALLRELDRAPLRPVRVAVAGALVSCAAVALSWLAWPEAPPRASESVVAIAVEPDAQLPVGVRARVAEVREELTRVRPLWEELQLGEAQQLSARLLDEARALDHPPLVAAAAVERGWVLYENGEFVPASAVLDEAYELAWAHGLDKSAADSASLHAVVRAELDDVEGGLAWARRAESAIERLPADERNEEIALFASARSQVFALAGRTEEARADAELAVAMIEATKPADDPALVLKLDALGSVVAESDRDAALEIYQRALSIAREAYGEEHPDVALVLLDIGSLHEVHDEPDLALPYFQRALEIYEGYYGSVHPHVGTALYDLGVVTEELGDPMAAALLFERAADVWSATLGPNNRRVALPITLLAYLAYEADDLATAEAYYLRALVLYEEGLGPDHPECTTPLSGLTEIAIRQGRGERAIELAERALTIAAGEPEAELAARRFRVARALDVAGRHAEALATAERALAELRIPEEIEEVEAWIRDRSGDPH